jgi:HD-GYP domain-containing protein (c-di-GMP phosphodiesterase class II)
MGLLRREPVEDSDFLAPLLQDLDFAERCDSAIEAACELCGTDVGYLYLRDVGGRRFLLTHRYQRPEREDHPRPRRTFLSAGSALPGSTQVDLPLSPDLGAGAADMSPSPSLELDATDESMWDQVVTTPAGRLHSMLLGRVRGEPAGLLMLGPVDGDLPAARLRVLAARQQELTVLFHTARILRDERHRATSAEAALDSASRLQESTLDSNQFLDLLLDLAVRATSATGGFVAVQDPDGELRLTTSRDLPEPFTDEMLSTSSGLFDWMAAESGVLIVRDVDLAVACGFTSILAVPLMEGAHHLGILAIFRTTAGPAITAEALDMLAAFAEQGRLMLAKANTFQAFAQEFVGTLAGLARSLDARSPYTRGHHAAVEGMARATARALGLEADVVASLGIAASIHDVGMAALAQRQRNLDVSDTDHPTIGASLVAPLPLSADVAAAIATHHEWFDGWGFPAGLSGHDIPIAGRVLAVSEFVAEMAAGNAVREAWDEERLVLELQRRSGSQFDPKVVEAAITCVTVVVDALAADHDPEEDR